MRTLIVKMLVLVGLCGAVVLWCNCKPKGLATPEDDLLGYRFLPARALLDTAFVGGSAASSVVRLQNLSESSLTLETLTGDCPSTITWSISNSTIDGGSSANLSLYFTPKQAYGESSCTLNPRFEGHPVVGTTQLDVQYAAGEAACGLSPEGPLNFAAVEVGSSADRTLTISNTTPEAITANQFEYVFQSPSSDCSVFLMEEADWTGLLVPGAPRDITVRFQPDVVGTFECKRDLVSRSLAGIPDHSNITNACPSPIVWEGTGVAPPLQWSVCQPEITADWRGIFTLSENEVYLLGDGGSVFESAGDCQWAPTRTIPGDVADVNLTAIWGYSDGTEKAVWAVGNVPPQPGWYGDTGAILKWDGNTWAVIDEDGLQTFTSVWGTGYDNVYFGGTGVSTDFPNAKHWDGSTLTKIRISDMGMSNVTGLSGTGNNDVWAVLHQSFDPVFRFQGSSWENMAPPFTAEPLNDVLVIPTPLVSTVYAVGDHGAIYRYDGSTWTDESIPGETRDFHAVWASPTGQLFVVGQDQTFYRGQVGDPTGWTVQSLPPGLPSGDLLDVWGSSDDDVYVVGTDGVVIRLAPGG